MITYDFETDITGIFSGDVVPIAGDTIQVGTIPPGATLRSIQFPYSKLKDRHVYLGGSYSLPKRRTMKPSRMLRKLTRDNCEEAAHSTAICVIVCIIVFGMIWCFYESIIREAELPDRDKFSSCYHTVKWKHYVCSKCHKDKNAEFVSKVNPNAEKGR